ncbi:hypothetical protein GpSGHVEth171 [Glossina pallidipes salivary gland hypertrophy virus]|uniref:Uncharacterized protein n=1 Tax=Glossina hytrovirus (isolate Glossina pallidipes/Ethiopia/Seibersdorf/-) TaxID=379529 RepID=A0A0Y0JA46_GHVS|nr:hypothetical protein GpSGHVEth171 [Glossina pallidipes salivary gland hypertrophy virus]
MDIKRKETADKQVVFEQLNKGFKQKLNENTKQLKQSKKDLNTILNTIIQLKQFDKV